MVPHFVPLGVQETVVLVLHYIFLKGANGHVAWPMSFLIGHVNVGGFHDEFKGTYVLNGILWGLNNHG